MHRHQLCRWHSSSSLSEPEDTPSQGIQGYCPKREDLYGLVLRFLATSDLQRERRAAQLCDKTGDVDNRKSLEYKPFIEFIYGKLVADKGYIGKNLFQRLFVDGIQLTTKLKSNMKWALMSVSNKLLHRKRANIETVNDKLKKIA